MIRAKCYFRLRKSDINFEEFLELVKNIDEKVE